MSNVRCTFCDAISPAGQRNCVSCGAELPGAMDLPANASETGNLEEEVVRLAHEHGIISAIKHYREVTGAGLAEAKAAVESLIAGVQAAGMQGQLAGEAEILVIVREQGKIAAIKRFRELTGCGLKEAKEAVEAMMARTGTRPGKSSAGCGTYVFVVILVCIGIVLVRAGGF